LKPNNIMILTLSQRVAALVSLGKYFEVNSAWRQSKLNPILAKVNATNNWFIPDYVNKAFNALHEMLKVENLIEWMSNYDIREVEIPKSVGLILAGNIPLVGFHDIMCVIISGNKAVIKTSKDDAILPQLIAETLLEIEPKLINYIHFEENKLQNFDAVIATGSNNTARYFDYYFGKYPHIIRKNRTSVALLSGNESINDLANLGNDVFNYFGLGCRNVSKLYVPVGYNFSTFFESIFDFGFVANNNKYANNYDYNRAIYLMGGEVFLDNNFLIIKESKDASSPVSVLHFEYYEDIESLKQSIESIRENLQCVVSNMPNIDGCIGFGKTQEPMLWDYADSVDTIKFLNNL